LVGEFYVFIELDGWMSRLRFSACHFTPGHPKCGRLHGHTYGVNVRIEGEQNGEFIMDFGELKPMIMGVCDLLDHKVLLAGRDDRIQVVEDGNDVEVIVIEDGKRYVFPKEDVVILPISSASAEDLCQFVASQLTALLSNHGNISSISVRVDEGIGQGAGCTMVL